MTHVFPLSAFLIRSSIHARHSQTFNRDIEMHSGIATSCDGHRHFGACRWVRCYFSVSLSMFSILNLIAFRLCRRTCHTLIFHNCRPSELRSLGNILTCLSCTSKIVTGVHPVDFERPNCLPWRPSGQTKGYKMKKKRRRTVKSTANVKEIYTLSESSKDPALQ
jgi:hypothetical protein